MDELKIENEPTSWRIYQNVKWLARLHDMKMYEVEQQVGVSQGFFSRCKGLNNSMSVDVVWKIAKLFGVSLDDLLTEDLFMNHIRDSMIRADFHLAYRVARYYFTDEELAAMVREFAKNPEGSTVTDFPKDIID